MFMKTKFALVSLFLLGLLGAAEAQGRTLEGQDFQLQISPQAKIVRRQDYGRQTVMTLEHEGQKIQVRFGPDDVLVNFPTNTLRLRRSITDSAGHTRTIVDFAGKRYTVKHSEREIVWLLPGQEVYFRTRGGKVSQAVGTADFLKVRRDTPSRRLVLESNAGTSDLSLVKGKLELFDGPELDGHIYFVRGLALQQGPVILHLPLPTDMFYDALPSDRYLRVVHRPEPLPEPETSAEAESTESRDPLQAKPSSWESPVYRANHGERKTDPLNARREKRTKSALDAEDQRNSEEVLKVKDY